MYEVKIPQLGVSMSEGVLEEWLVSNGDIVVPGTPLYVVSTDKVENQIDAPAGGTVELIGAAGETYEVGTTIARIS